MGISNTKIAILGAGNLGIAIAEGIVDKQLAKAGELILTRRKVKLLNSLTQLGFQVSADNQKAAADADMILLCVQPKQLAQLCDEIRPSLTLHKTIVSVITGVSLEQLHAQLGADLAIVRAMPNTAIAIGESMTCLATNGEEDRMEKVEAIFNTLGKTMRIHEGLMQAATVLGASGIAFFMRYLRAATQAGIQMGFHSEEAQLIAVQTAKGAASLILENNTHPEVEIDKVTTPQGCTIEGLNEMEHQGFSSSLIKGVMTSFHKIKNIQS